MTPATEASQRLQDLLADKGHVLDTSTIAVPGTRRGTEPEAASDSTGGAVHHVSSGTYIDGSGHLHAVLYDDVTTFIEGVPNPQTVIEILSDVTVT